MARASTNLQVSSRTPEGSRAARRLRRTGRVPGVLYGGGGDPLSFDVDARELRLALAAAGAVLDLSVDGARATPVVLKDAQRDAVRGHTVHVDLLRVNLDTAISAVVPLELTGADDAPGAREGGVLEQITRELNVEALPNDIPEAITHDVSELQINDTVMLEALSVPAGVTLLDDPETVIATLTPPRLQAELEEIEAETALVGEEAARAEGEPEAEADASEGEAPAAGESTDGGGAEA
jgi:large subunit ribosomal protein L25